MYEILKKHKHFIREHEFLNNLFPENCFQVVHRRGRNLKELILRADPYTVKPRPVGCYEKCGECDSCKNFVSGQTKIKVFATGRVFQLLKVMDCKTPYVVYAGECLRCGEQGVGSTVNWKPRLSNYKSHIKKGINTCGIVKHFLEDCVDHEDPCGNLIFFIIDGLNNTDGLSMEQIDNLLLQKEKFRIGTLVTMHKGMNLSHDWNRTSRNQQVQRSNSLA